jgi:PAS domain S-box-containing protein
MHSAANILTEHTSVQEGQRLMRLVLETLPVGVVVTDRDGDIIIANEAARRIWGDLIVSGLERRMRTKGFWHESGKRIEPEKWPGVRAAFRGETQLNELIDIDAFDGQRKIIRNSAAPVRNSDGVIVGAVIVNEDVTDRVRAEEALRRSEDELRLVVDTIPVMAWTLGADGIVDFLNRRWTEYSGLSLEHYVSDPTGPIHPEDATRVLERWRVQLGIGEGYDDEMRLRRADGEYRWFLVRTAPLRDQQGNIVKWYGVSTDIEDRKRAEQALRQASDRLRILSRRRVQVQEEERQRLARELHDQVGQLLTAAKIDVQSAGALSEDPEVNDKLIGVARILETVLQEVRKISFALRPPVLDDLGLAPALRWMLSDLARSAGLKAEFLADSSLRRADAESETACYRVAVEAVTNAIRHAGARKIAMELRNVDRTIQLRVRDDGRGFDLAKIERGGERERLGLSGMHERTLAVGGQFEIKSAPGEGTEIIARFPISSASERR